MRNAGLEEAQAGIKIAGRNINNLRYADDTTLMAENEEEPKSLFMRMKEEKEMATHSSILAWRIPWTEEPGGLQSTGSQSRTRLRDFTHTHNTYIWNLESW